MRDGEDRAVLELFLQGLLDEFVSLKIYVSSCFIKEDELALLESDTS